MIKEEKRAVEEEEANVGNLLNDYNSSQLKNVFLNIINEAKKSLRKVFQSILNIGKFGSNTIST